MSFHENDTVEVSLSAPYAGPGHAFPAIGIEVERGGSKVVSGEEANHIKETVEGHRVAREDSWSFEVVEEFEAEKLEDLISERRAEILRGEGIDLEEARQMEKKALTEIDGIGPSTADSILS